MSQVLPAGGGPVIPDVDAHTVLWPMSLVSWKTSLGERLVVLCSRIRRGTSGGAFDFTYIGSSSAVFDIPGNGVPRLLTVKPITPDNPDKTQINWGAASFNTASWIYVYGTRLTGEQYDLGRELYVARVPMASPANRATYRFWDGSSWQPDITRATAILPAQGGVSQTLSVDELAAQDYIAVSKRDGDLGDFIYTWDSSTPRGPLTPHKAIAAPSDFDAGLLKYAPLAHPEVPLGNGELLVTVSRNTTDLSRLIADPTLGVPEFVQVPFP
jgi:Domain of unknown function (DUF4185)